MPVTLARRLRRIAIRRLARQTQGTQQVTPSGDQACQLVKNMRAYAPMTKCALIPNFLGFYNILWQAALPILRRHPRLAHTFSQRMDGDHLPGADIWIQAASAGEAFLALSILRRLTPDRPVTVLVTTTTDQGREILSQGIESQERHPNVRPQLAWFPFDRVPTMARAVKRINPSVMVLLETEIWPALLHHLKKNNTRILILNARMSAKSARHYRLTRRIWQGLAPDRILATSARDADRYKRIFPSTPVDLMENVKFDIMETGRTQGNGPAQDSSLARLVPDHLPLSILASIRKQEEGEVIRIISRLQKAYPNQVIALFPRHMHRVGPVKRQLESRGFPVSLGSELKSPLTGPGVVLWDRFGELRAAYRWGTTVFVGGSLAPLGGQNFLEPATLGIPTVIGPHWSDFNWVGRDIFTQGIVTQCPDGAAIARTMAGHLASPPDINARRKTATAYIRQHRGGSETACRAILDALDASGTGRQSNPV